MLTPGAPGGACTSSPVDQADDLADDGQVVASATISVEGAVVLDIGLEDGVEDIIVGGCRRRTVRA
ncbi:MAG: hypothetical protein U5Q44_08420 [Dehalococcoidia bacterium]|nr:hypothetical protein [Dehalococcoidia bacterium]